MLTALLEALHATLGGLILFQFSALRSTAVSNP